MTPFAESRALTVGAEEELLLVDPETLRLAPVAPAVLARIGLEPEAAGSEAYAAQIELRAGPAETSADLVERLCQVRAAARRAGATLLAAGVHPTAELGDAPLSPDDRYRDVDRTVRGLIRRTPESALHVHVGMADAEEAVRAHNRLRAYLPLLQALSANSPWWFGEDSGLASARYALVRSYPGRGIPPALRDYADWEARLAEITAAGGLEDYTFVWSDIRLHPRHGTVEVREMDVQPRPDDVAALVALVRSLAAEAMGTSDDDAVVSSEALDWSAFRAARDGVEARILCDGSLQPVRSIAPALVERLRDVAQGLGEEAQLLGVVDLVERGGGAALQRRAYAAGGTEALLRSAIVDSGG